MYELRRGDIVCFDSNVIIWGFIQESDTTNADKISKSIHLIEECSRLEVNVVIPSIALAEVISGCKSKKTAEKIHSEIFKSFRVVPFDSMAAFQYSELWRVKKKSQKGKNKIEGTRNTLKADCMIIATALSAKAHCIYTGNNEVEKFKKLAQSKIEVESPPGFLQQTTLEV
ncbi:MAG: PIN domain-containing protein [Cyanobacteria bacterium P01_E01_bin.6]